MKSESIIFEWKECRDTIGRFDNYLLRLRLLGFSVFTLLFTTIIGVAGIKKGVVSALTPATLLFAILTLTLFIVSIYILDRYYERMLLVAVYRASRLEAHRLEGFRIGLTTEIEFQKEKISGKLRRSNFLKASHMVNFVYAMIFLTMLVQYFILATRIEQNFSYYIVLLVVVIIVSLMMFFANMLLSEPGALISLRSQVVQSPVVMSRVEIKYSIKKIATQVTQWVEAEKTHELHIISILSGARPFTEDLIDELERNKLSVTLHIICAEATKEDDHLEECQLVYGVVEDGIKNKLVLIVDDLLDSGKTLQRVKNSINDYGAKSIKAAVLVNKFSEVNGNADFVGLNLGLHKDKLAKTGIKDYWLFGYGMDLNGQYRDIEHIGWVKKELQI